MDQPQLNRMTPRDILIVEDSPTQAIQLEHLLSTHSYRVAVARNGRDALTQAAATPPDLIITDVVMPEMDGFQLCSSLKSREDLRHIPVILLTSLSSPQDVLRGLQSGADCFIRKPYDERQLMSQVEYILLNAEIRKNDRLHVGVQLYFGGNKHFITAEKQQILDLLVSTYESALQLNQELSSNQMELAQERDLLHTLLDNLPDLIYFKDLEGRFTRINRALGVAFGLYHADGALGKTDADFFSEEYTRQIQGDDEALLTTKEPIIARVELMTLRSGASLWVSTTRMLRRDLEGRVVGTFGVSRDIMQVKEAEAAVRRANEELEGRVRERTAELASANARLELELAERERAQKMEREAHARFRFLFASNPIPMWVYNPGTGRIVEVNDAALKNYGFTQEEFLALRVADLEIESGAAGSQSGVLKHRAKDGRTIEVEVVENSMDWGTAGIANLVVAKDVTEERRLQREFIQAQKMEAIGRLAAGVAHDFNNLLTVVNGYSGVLLDSVEQGEPFHEELSEILRAGERAAGLTRQLLAFSRKSISETVVFDLNDVVSEVDRMLKRVIGEDVELLTVLAPAPCSIKADPGQIQQVIMNLAVNARDAMPEGGRLTIETACVHFDDSVSGGHPRPVSPGPYAMLAVTDTGVGMSGETLARIFEPFFTTKEPGKGTGLGLSTVYAIVEQAGGTIFLHSELGHGTTFKIYLPCAAGINASLSRTVPTAMPAGNETVLVAEDEDMVRTLACRILHRLGYHVLAAADGPAALAIGEQYGGRIDLLITDLVMPGMNGTDLAELLQRRQRDLRVLYISGYADHGIIQTGLLAPNSAFLTKPFAAHALAQKVRKVIDGQLVS